MHCNLFVLDLISIQIFSITYIKKKEKKKHAQSL